MRGARNFPHALSLADHFNLVKELVQLALETAKALERRQLYEEYAKHTDALALSFTRFIFDLAQEVRQELSLERIELTDAQKKTVDKHS